MDSKLHDVIMIGGGPTSLSAAVYTAREDLDTVIIEKAVVGGMAAITDQIDNYPGFAEGVAGMELADQLQKQAERFGAKIEYGEVQSIRREGDVLVVVTDMGELKAKAVLVGTGSDYNKINVPGEAEYYGRGVHYCATCDGAFYRDKKLAVVGGGNSGVQEAIFLTRFASHINLIVRSTLKASAVLQREMQKYVDEGKITIHLQTTIDEIKATDSKVATVALDTNGEKSEITVDGVFVFVGLKPNTQFLEGTEVQLDDQKLVVTDNTFHTHMNGVFASGDVRSGATMQVASAVGEGASAALAIRHYLEDLERE